LTTDAQFDALARFHRALVEEISRTRPTYLREPFTVAEIYQNLVPYRTHRDRIGVEMNGDYEDALLRLLAGEGEYLHLESEHARNEIAAELLSPNPNTGLFREFAAVDVRLNPLRLPRDLPDSAPGPMAGLFEPPDIDLGMLERAGPSAPSPSAPAPQAAPVHGACPWCREALPGRATLNFCPFCGADQHTRPCSTCGEELEAGWRFCVACGTAVGDVG
jgi:hypothetical protein